MIAALGSKAKEVHFNMQAKSKHYFQRMGLLSHLGIAPLMSITEHEAAGRFIPITTIKNSSELTNFIEDMIPLLHLRPKQAEPIKYIVSELVRNVLEHAQAATGAFVCAQYYAKSNTIRLGIVDTGVGIKSSISRAYDVDTDIAAIRLALIPGITGTTNMEGGTAQNAGAGLFFIKSIATVNRDFFMIYSGDSLYKLLRQQSDKPRLHGDPFRDNHSKSEGLPYWQGTVVGIDINLDDTEEFSVMLELIRQTYVNVLRERRKEKYKQPRFI
jgi:anti-sigma regulatory factor (Ser/Thr protein kinase)